MIERRRENPRLSRERELQTPQLDPERNEPLLSAVVQITLQPTALLVSGLHDPAPGLVYLRELQPHLDGQPTHLDGEPRRRDDAGQQIPALEQHRIMKQYRRLGVVPRDLDACTLVVR